MKKQSFTTFVTMLCISACGGVDHDTGATPPAIAQNPDSGTLVPVPVPPVPSGTPTVSNVSSTSVAVGKNVTIMGSGLDRVERYELGAITLQIVSTSATSATLRMPVQAASGTLILISGAEHVNSGYALNAFVPLAVTAMEPDTGVEGTSMTITGTGLDSLIGVTFANGTAATVSSRQSGNSVTVLVPPGAQSGKLSFNGSYNQAASATAFTVLQRPTVAAISSASEGGKLLIDIDGQHLDTVTAASVGPTPASIDTTSATRLRLSVPLGSTGTVTLSAQARPVVIAGTIGAYTIAGINVSQVFNREASSSALKVTAGKVMAVHAAILATVANQASPDVTLNATAASGTSLGSLKMSGPAILPEKKDDAALSSNFNAVLPAHWVQPGLTLRVTVARADSVAVSQSTTPIVTSAPKLDLVLVPLTSDSGTGILPPVAKIREALARLYPYAPVDITVRTRAAMPFAGDSTTFAWLKDALAAVEQLRVQESPNAFYYGLMHRPKTDGSFTAGLGYENFRDAASPKTTGVGVDVEYGGWEAPPGPLSAADAQRQRVEDANMKTDAFGNKWPVWLTSLIHELGHNHSLKHANCGPLAEGTVDAAFPYPLGDMGPSLIYESVYDDEQLGKLSKPEINGVTMKDTMGYCKGTWFSDYSYTGIQQFLINRLAVQQRARAVSALVSGSTDDYLTLSGKITATGLQWRPPLASSVRLQNDGHGSQAAYTLRVLSRAGQTFDLPFDAVALDHGQAGESDFMVSLPNPGAIAAVTVLNHQKLALRQIPAKAAPGGTATGTATLSWTQNNGKLDLQWNAMAEPYVSVVYVAANGARMVLAQSLRGGSASLDVSTAKAGGVFEVSLATQFSARLVRVAVK